MAPRGGTATPTTAKRHGGLSTTPSRPQAELARLEFCSHCDDPHIEGSFADGLTALQGRRDYRVAGGLVYALPNDASTKPLNAAEIRGHVAIVHRSTTPFVKKVLACQEAGATAVVVVGRAGRYPNVEMRSRCDVKTF